MSALASTAVKAHWTPRVSASQNAHKSDEARPGLIAGIPHCSTLLSPTYHWPHTELAPCQQLLGTYRLRVLCPCAAKKNLEAACPAAGLPFLQAVSAEKKARFTKKQRLSTSTKSCAIFSNK